MKKILFILISIITLIFSSCSSLLFDDCPYLVSNLRMDIKDSKKDIANVVFDFRNNSSKEINGFVVSFFLYDSDGTNPFIGSNNVVSKCYGKVVSGDTAEFTVNIDDKLTIIPDEPYKIDFFYIKEILYIDGTKWTDPFGMYASREAMNDE